MPFARRNWLLIISGTIIWSLSMVKSGLPTAWGLGFWGPNGHDGIWHMAVISGLLRGSSALPMFSGVPFSNYHLGFDLLLAALHLLTRIPVSWLYFQILPPLFALAIGWFSFRVARTIWGSAIITPLLFLVYFATGWGWLVSLWTRRGWGGESIFWSQQSLSTLLNPPYALSLIVLLVGLLSLHRFRSRPTKSLAIFNIICFALLPSIKVYAGILAFVGLGFLSLRDWHRGYKLTLGICLASSVLAAAIFLPLNSGSARLLIWQPAWFLETLMALSDRFNWPRFYQAMTNYRLAGAWGKAFAAYFAAALIFIFGNLGPRAVVFFKPRHTPHSWDWFFIPAILAGLIIPLLFVQSGTPWNTIQFFYYSLFFANFYAASALSKLPRYVSGLTIILTLPSILGFLPNYLPSRPPAVLPPAEIEALSFLSSRAPGTVLTPVYDKYAAVAAQSQPPRPLRLYESTAYVSAFSNHPVYLEDEVNLSILGQDYPLRRSQTERLFSTKDPVWAKQFLHSQQIRYLYLPQVSSVRPYLDDRQLGLTKIFENFQVAIWENPY